MTRRLPSTTTLLALETAARHQSFARAAQELALSEAAISRQIGKLESTLGVRLFLREGNRVVLTPAGARYADGIREALARIERETRQLQEPASGRATLEIGVVPTMASRWLIPRMARFHQRHPEIAVNLHERTRPFDLAGSNLHAAIAFDHPEWSALAVEALFETPLLPVCHPDLAGQPAARVPLLQKLESPYGWTQYAQASGVSLPTPQAGLRYDRYALLIEAARAGIGMALVPRQYIEDDLASGRLCAPWPLAPALAERYVLVSQSDSSSALQHFRHWLLEEAAEHRASRQMA
ncbi:MAG: Glycine cleavage system transcriptional activator [Pseudomonas citronellolis]|nr:MAG: Glycine cleavage system transcriptional activator [Pseudomonas citronellolis]